MPEVVELREVTDRRDVVHRSVQRLNAGEGVVLPSESGPILAASALNLPAAWSWESDEPPVVLLRGADELLDFAPHASPMVRRLAKRCWPGPLILRIPHEDSPSFSGAMPGVIFQRWQRDGCWSARVSSHPVLSEVAKLLRGPLVLCDGTSSTASAAATLIVQEHSPSVSPATVVQVNSRGWQVERQGAITEQRLQLAACELLLFVCTGNTCRSPMAEALCRKMLAERLKCDPQELPQRGFLIGSAGLAADYGGPASPESVEMMHRRGIDLRAHASQPLTERLIEQADRCWTMTRQHRNAILDSHPDAVDRVQLLSRDGGDLSDPIGSGPAEYAACADSIERHLTKILDELFSEHART